MINPAMKYSQTGLNMTEREEGLRFVAYRDQVGVWTIGYGHTHGVFEGVTCTRDQAEAWLRDDIALCELDVNTHVNVDITQGEFDALVDFSFNLGCNALNGSTLLRYLNAGDFHAAANEFEKWDHAGGKVVAGLLRRRQREEAEFESAQAPA